VFLHYQEHAMVEDEAQKGQGWRKHYYMPTRADTLVAAFKNWLDVVGGGGPYGPLYQAPGYPPLQHDHKVLLNRYEQHTKSCKACSGALKWVERWRAVTAVVSAVGFAVAVVAGVQVWGAGGGAAAVRPLAGGVLVGLVGALVTYWLSKTREAFYFVDYVHAAR